MPPKNVKKKVATKKSPKKRVKSPAKKRTVAKKSPLKLKKENKAYKKLHLVLDLDATLVDSYIDEGAKELYDLIQRYAKVHNPDFMKRVVKFRIPGVIDFGFTILRPYTMEFLNFASRFFRKISVWTAGTKDYAEEMVRILFQPPLMIPEIVFSRDDCLSTKIKVPKKASTLLNNLKDMMQQASPSNPTTRMLYKPLISLAKFEFDIMNQDKEVTLTNNDDVEKLLKDILILDDRDDICIYNPHNLIQIPKFEHEFDFCQDEADFKTEIMKADTCLNQFCESFFKDKVWLEDFHDDVRKILSTCPINFS